MELSIITPAYNAENFIEAMIHSVLLQPMPIELIIVDDGSTDRTAEIVQAFAGSNPNIRLIRQENRGTGFARNRGIGAATSDWLIFLDQDDMLLPGSIGQEILDKLYQYDKNGIDIVYTAKSKTSLDLGDAVQISYPEAISQIRNHIPLNEFWTCIYRRAYLVGAGVYFAEYREMDIETAYRFKAFSRTSRIVADPEIHFYLQRVNPISGSHTWSVLKMYYVKAFVYSELVKETSRKPYFATHKDIAYLKYVVFHCLYHYFKTIKVSGYDSSLPDEQAQKMIELWKREGGFVQRR
ncbi:MAG: glycosyltransferase family 2 protein [Clostridiales bacterium]|nr:glycosyltransferase family 2 protein [Clostridiales bacterium]